MARLGQASFAAGEIDPGLHKRPDLEFFREALAECTNFIVRAGGGVYNRAGTELAAAAYQSNFALYPSGTAGALSTVHLIPFIRTKTDAYVMVMYGSSDYIRFRLLRNGGWVRLSYTPAAWAISTSYAQGDVKSHGGVNYYCVIVHSSLAADEPGVGVNWKYYWWPLEDDIVEIPCDPYIPYVSKPPIGSSPINFNGVTYSQINDIMVTAWGGYWWPQRITRYDHDDWLVEPFPFAPAMTRPGGLSKTASGSGAQFYYDVTAVNAEGVESQPTEITGVETSGATLTWYAVTDAAYYNIYKGDQYQKGFVAKTTTNSYVTQGYAPDYADPPPETREPFDGPDAVPRAVAIHDQRLVFGGSYNSPNLIEHSSTGSIYDFSHPSPSDPSDAFSVYVRGPYAADILHLLGKDDLFVFCVGSIMHITSDNAAYTQENVRRVVDSELGCGDVKPVSADGVMVFIAPNNRTVHDLDYSADSERYKTRNITLRAQHLFEGHTIVDAAYQPGDNPVLWFVRDDGVLLGATYIPELSLIAWHKHNMPNRYVRKVCCIPESGEWRLYLHIQHTTSGTYNYTFERMHDREYTDIEDAVFLDSSISGSGAATDTWSGLGHLEGMTVTAFGDGKVYSGLTVASGSVTLPEAVSKVCIGLPYTSQLKTLEPPMEGGYGHVKAVSNLLLTVKDTIGGFIGTDADSLHALPTRYVEDGYDSPQPKTLTIEHVIEPDWFSDGQLVVQQPDPLPMTVLAIVPDVDVGG